MLVYNICSAATQREKENTITQHWLRSIEPVAPASRWHGIGTWRLKSGGKMPVDRKKG